MAKEELLIAFSVEVITLEEALIEEVGAVSTASESFKEVDKRDTGWVVSEFLFESELICNAVDLTELFSSVVVPSMFPGVGNILLEILDTLPVDILLEFSLWGTEYE